MGIEVRKFNGKSFVAVGSRRTKREAVEKAQRFRNKGALARVTKSAQGGYDIWVNPGKDFP